MLIIVVEGEICTMSVGRGYLFADAGLPTVDHCEVHTPSPTWQFVSDYKKKKTRARTK